MRPSSYTSLPFPSYSPSSTLSYLPPTKLFPYSLLLSHPSPTPSLHLQENSTTSTLGKKPPYPYPYSSLSFSPHTLFHTSPSPTPSFRLISCPPPFPLAPTVRITAWKRNTRKECVPGHKGDNLVAFTHARVFISTQSHSTSFQLLLSCFSLSLFPILGISFPAFLISLFL